MPPTPWWVQNRSVLHHPARARWYQSESRLPGGSRVPVMLSDMEKNPLLPSVDVLLSIGGAVLALVVLAAVIATVVLAVRRRRSS